MRGTSKDTKTVHFFGPSDVVPSFVSIHGLTMGTYAIISGRRTRRINHRYRLTLVIALRGTLIRRLLCNYLTPHKSYICHIMGLLYLFNINGFLLYGISNLYFHRVFGLFLYRRVLRFLPRLQVTCPQFQTVLIYRVMIATRTQGQRVMLYRRLANRLYNALRYVLESGMRTIPLRTTRFGTSKVDIPTIIMMATTTFPTTVPYHITILCTLRGTIQICGMIYANARSTFSYGGIYVILYHVTIIKHGIWTGPICQRQASLLVIIQVTLFGQGARLLALLFQYNMNRHHLKVHGAHYNKICRRTRSDRARNGGLCQVERRQGGTIPRDHPAHGYLQIGTGHHGHCKRRTGPGPQILRSCESVCLRALASRCNL